MNIIASIVIYKHTYIDLKETLDSLLAINQIGKIILIDNDQSEWANQLTHDRIHYIKSPGNFGFGFGHNIAINKYIEQCDFFLICNPDIYFEVDEFQKMINFAQTRQEGLFLPQIIYPNGENQYGARLLPSPMNLFARRFYPQYAKKLDKLYLLKSFNGTEPIFAPSLSGCFMLFRAKALRELKGFDERFFMYMEDVDLSRRCAEKFGNIYYPLAKVVHKHEQGSYKNPVLLKAHIRSAWQYFNKWGWFFDQKRNVMNDSCLKQFM